MIQGLKNHPFAVAAHFERSLVLTFAVPPDRLAGLLPECLTLDTFQDRWAFLAVALVQTRDLRPKGFPKFLGSDFFLIGYRVFVRYTSPAGKRLRGLYILKSATNKRRMELLGNLFTHYDYSTTDIRQTTTGGVHTIASTQSGFHVATEQPKEAVPLPDSSPFPDWKTARRFAGPLPFTFTYDRPSKEVLIIEGVRQNWRPEPVWVVDYRFPFLAELQLSDAVLASGFVVTNIPYYWKKGRIEKWT